ncbi:transposase [Cucumis melo var. makuwa]|uniref:Transposase n=1 Tax=Cucumis melo var. makuwa TaxID=1194695 RepID=A0A5D3D2T0_CUCMM|nr:transposase [Cucumis melo var. makuwa]
MDKSWMMENRMSREYDIGVESFIQFGLSHAKGYNSIRCPCLKCGNRLLKDVSIVRYHLYASGIDKSYKIWFWHGEDLNSETVTSKMENIGDEKYEHDDLFNTVNMLQSAHDESCNTSNTFDTMFDDAKKPLYPGCKKFTKLSALVRLYNLKVRYGWSNTSFSELLSIISDLLPDNNEIPTSLYEAKKTLGALGLSYQKIDACSNDCCLYRKEYANSTKCPKCGLSRWKINKNSTKENSGVAAKQMWYFPIVPRFIRMFKNLENAKNLRWHAMDRKIDDIMRHPADTPSWRLIDHMWPTFGSEPRNLRLGPKQPGYDINTYLAPLIDDLKILWEEGNICNALVEERAQLLTARLLGTDYDQLLLFPYNSGNHWTLVVINLTKGAAFWIDPLKNRIDPDVTEVVERSFNIMNKKKPAWRVVKCPKQSGVVECGYYVMRFMRDIIMSTSTSIIQIMKDSPRAYTQDEIDCIRSEWAEFVGKHVHCA